MAEERYNIFRSTVHWRYAMARPNLLFFDARLVFFIGLFAFHIRWWTFATLIFAISGLAGASYFNYSLESLWRLIRSKVVGTFRPAIPHTRLRPMLDFGGDSLRSIWFSSNESANEHKQQRGKVDGSYEPRKSILKFFKISRVMRL